MDAVHVMVAACGLVAAGVIKGATGLGYSTCALPFLASSVGLRAAMVIVLAPAISTNLSVACTAGHFKETCSRFYRFYLASLAGIGCGALLLAMSDVRIATRALGAIVLAYAVMALVRADLSLPARLASRLQAPAGFANGVITGLTGSQVMPLLPYMMALDLEPGRLVQAINLSVLWSSLVLAGALTAAGGVDPAWFLASLAAVAPALAGVALGNRARNLIPARHFRTLVLIVLLVMGAGLASG